MKRGAEKQRSMLHTLKARFLGSVALAALIFCAAMILLNLLFFHDYYLSQKKNTLINTYHEINTSLTDSGSIQEDELASIETVNNIRISIINSYGQYLYDTMFNHDRSNNGMFMGDLFGNQTYVFDKTELEQNGYTISQQDNDSGDTDYLALLGKLDNGGKILLRIPTAALRENQSVNFIFLLISGLAALLACLIAGYFIGAHFTRPVTEMTEVANAVAQLDFSKRCTESRNDELGELGHSINQMSEYLQHSIEELQRINAQLHTEIDKKQQIDDMRREFIINVSHDLKTPIALIQGYAEGLRIGINESEEDKNYYCDIIMDEAKRMNQLVLQLLELSRIEMGNTLPEPTDFEAYELAEIVCTKTQVMWQSKNLHIDLSGVGEQILHADYDMMERVLMNYVTNAIDHTPEGGCIRISSEEDSKHTIVRVFNQGQHLNPDEMDKIWDKFYKLDKSRTRVSGGGSGIGLSIVRVIMDAHHGGCGVRNVEDGVEFYITLPKETTQNSEI